MSTIVETITQQFAGSTLKDLASRVGADENSTKSALAVALPVILGALARNASKPDGAASLHRALEKDHDGGILDNLAGFFKTGQTTDGDAILKHVLGTRRQAVETGAAKTSGMSAAQMAKMMAVVAPLVMGALGRKQRQSNMDSTKLAGYLGEESQTLERAVPQGANVLNQLLDTDGDGDVDLSDIAKRGRDVLGKLFGG